MLSFLFTKTPLVFLVQSFWRDEAFTYVMSKQNILQILTTTAKDFNPPFYYVVMHFWIIFAGRSEIAMRLISFIMYWATLYIIYLFMTELFHIDIKKSLWYLLFVAINPFLVYYAFEVRMYMMLAFFVTLSSYAFLKQKNKLYVIITILGLYTHYFMIFIVLLQFSYSLFAKKMKLKTDLLTYMLLPIVFFAPWLLYVFISKNMQSGSFWITAPNIETLITIPGTILTGYEQELTYYNQYIITASILATAVLITGLYFIIKKNALKPIVVYLLLWSPGIPFFLYVISYLKPIYLPRYFIFSCIGLNLLLIYSFEHTPKKVRNILIVIIVILIVHYNEYQALARTKSDLRKTFSQINAIASKQDVVYVTNELDYFTAEYYFGLARVYIYGKSYESLPDYIGKVLIPPSHIAYHLPIYPQKAFVMTSDTHFEIQSSR